MEESDFITDKAQVRQTASNVRDTNDRDMSFDTSMNNNTLSLKPDFTNEAAFASARTEEERVNASDIFGQEESRGKVHLSDGNFYIKKDSSSLDSFAVEAENDMDVGDGTFINLSGAESTQLKEFEDTNPNIQNEDTVNTGAGIGTAIRGKYGNTGLEQSQRELPSLRLMGHLANDAGQNRREFIKDPYKQESD